MTNYSENFSFKYKVQILERHLDFLGHVNNATYLELYEEARWDFMTRGGHGVIKVMEEKKGPILLEVDVKFKKEILNREEITIYSYPQEFRKKVMTMKQVMEKANGEIASIANFVFGFMDLRERKLITPTESWLEAISEEKHSSNK